MPLIVCMGRICIIITCLHITNGMCDYGPFRFVMCCGLIIHLIYILPNEAIEYYVKPTDSVNVTCPPSQPCLTINQYTDPSNNYLVLNNTVFTFLPGKHVMKRPMEFNNVENITLQGMEDNDSAYPYLTPAFSCKNRDDISYPYDIHYFNMTLCNCSTIQLKRVANININRLTIGTTVNITGIIIESSTDINTIENIITSNDIFINYSHGVGMFIKDSDNITIEYLQTSSVVFGVVIWKVSSVFIQNSLFQHCLYSGIHMIETISISLLNLSSYHSDGHGIMVSSTKNTSLENVNVTFNGLVGIFIENCTNTKMISITSIYNKVNGLHVYKSTNTELMTVSSMNNQNSGIYVHMSTNTRMRNISSINNLINVRQSTDTTMIDISFINNQDIGIATISGSVLFLKMCVNLNITNLLISVGRNFDHNAISFFDCTNILVEESGFSEIMSKLPQNILNVPAIITLWNTNLTLKNCNFTSNMITSIAATSSNIRVKGNILFENITAISGAAFIFSRSSVLIVSEQSNVVFRNNIANRHGAAFYILTEEVPEDSVFINDLINSATGSFMTSGTQCFVQVEGTRSSTAHLKFINNTAQEGGDVIYGGQIASGYDGDWNCLLSFKNISDMTYQPSDRKISSAPSRVCLCHDTSPDCLIVVDPTTHTLYPGETLTVSAAVVGQDFGTVSGDVYGKFLDTNFSVQTNQKSMSYKNGPCSNLNYTLYSNCEECEAVFVLTSNTNISNKMNATDNRRLNHSWSILHSEPDYHALAVYYVQKLITGGVIPHLSVEYNDIINSVIDNFFTFSNEHFDIYQLQFIQNKMRFPKQIYTYPLYVNITFRHCPLGFTLFQSKCVCNHLLRHMPTVKCDIQTQTINRAGSVWVGVDGNGTVAASQYCPFNYCKMEPIQLTLQDGNSSGPDSQCNFNHSGILCGGCQPGLSLTLGSSKQCLLCSNLYLSLILPFSLAAVFLVLVIKVLDLTVCQGTVNGLIFYANVVNANKHLYYNQSDINPFTLFISSFNDEMGGKVCFYDGLTAYARTWLQFAFPVYIWCIAGAVIFLAKHSKKMVILSGNNGVPVLATMFLLSYARLFNTIVSVISYTTLYTTQGQRLVWSVDGNVDYLGPEHAPLFVVAVAALLFLWLPYTMLLLLGKYLHKVNCRLITRYLLNLKPFLDANYAPFHVGHQYWFGAILLVKAAILLSSATIPVRGAQSIVLSVAILSLVLLFWGNMVFHNTKAMLFHTSLFVNLCVLNITKLYFFDDMVKMTIASYILIGIVFVQFFGLCVVKVFKRFSFIWGDCAICNKRKKMEDDWEPYMMAARLREEESERDEDKDSLLSGSTQSLSTCTYPLV